MLVPNSFIAIKGVRMPTPASMSYTLQDFDSDLSTRSTDGTMVRDRITVKRKLECSWLVLDPDEVSLLLKTVYTSNGEYNAISQDSVTLPATYEEYSQMSVTEQNQLLTDIQNYTGVKVDPVKYYEDNDYQQSTNDKISDGLADFNAERNDRIFFPITFYEPMLKRYDTMTVYVGDRTVPWLWAQAKNKNLEDPMTVANHYQMFENVTMNFIEK